MSPSPAMDNPFWVLDLPPETARVEVERTGQKLLAQLEIGVSAVKQYPTPSGPRPRTPEAVRAALAELRDPAKRILWELRAGLGPMEPPELSAPPANLWPPWPDARVVLGWPGC